MKRNNTKKALVLSAISILVCLTMLIGSTFAWFTDTASTAVNRIESGTLDIVLEYQDGDDWKNAEGETLAWNRACENGTGLWEPGCTYSLPAIRVRNNGNLSLKYKICINGIRGDAKLNEAINWTIKIGDVDFPLEGFEGVLLPEGVTGHDDDNNELPSGSTDSLVISGHMREDAGNEYQGLTIYGIGITVAATQYNWECDSNGHDYDKDAPLIEVEPETAQEALDDAASGTVMSLTAGEYSGLTFRNHKVADITETGSDGQGHTMRTYTRVLGDFTIIGEPGAVITTPIDLAGSSGYIDTNGIDAEVAIQKYEIGTLVFDGITFKGGQFNISDLDSGVKAGKIVFNNCIFDMTGITSGDTRALYISSNTNEIENVTLQSCSFINACNSINQYIQVAGTVENSSLELNIIGCVFNGQVHNAINIAGTPSYIGKITISDNEIRNTRDRAIRIGKIGANAVVVISGNAMFDSADDDGQVYKHTSADSTAQITYTDNTLNGALTELNDGVATVASE